jgi:hypothetical protein
VFDGTKGTWVEDPTVVDVDVTLARLVDVFVGRSVLVTVLVKLPVEDGVSVAVITSDDAETGVLVGTIATAGSKVGTAVWGKSDGNTIKVGITVALCCLRLVMYIVNRLMVTSRTASAASRTKSRR